jgi:hypothetical protein
MHSALGDYGLTGHTQKLKTIESEEEAKKRGFPNGAPFKLLEKDLVLLTEDEAAVAREKVTQANLVAKNF